MKKVTDMIAKLDEISDRIETGEIQVNVARAIVGIQKAKNPMLKLIHDAADKQGILEQLNDSYGLKTPPPR